MITLDNYKTFPQEYNAYFNDNMSFRNSLISINSAIDYFCFKKSSNESVIVGEDDWLFYSSKSDGSPIEDYQGTNLLTSDELKQIADNCLAQRDFLAKQGKEFVIFIAPNKERIYYEKIPRKYDTPSKMYVAKQIVDYLQNNTDLRVVYPYDELIKAKKELKENIYFKTDTHWNNIGGYVGAKELLSNLDIKLPEINDKKITISKVQNESCDLAAMLNLKSILKDKDYEYHIEGYYKNGVNCLKYDFNNEIIYEAKNVDSRKIYVCRDSFSSAMIPYISSQFNNSYFRHHNTYSYEDFKNQDPDVFVYETVERYVGRLKDFSIN